jgi:paraquat-inducible protein B
MPEMQKPNPSIPESQVMPRKRFRFSFIWLIPIVAAIVGIWIGVTTIRNQGPTITITFKSAAGLEAGKTKIRYQGLDVGIISDIRLSADRQSVVAAAKMNPGTEAFFVKDTTFWVVKARISGADISGLSTLISGDYVGMEIGESSTRTHNFVALDEAPMETGGIQGHFYTLTMPELDSLTRGTPIYFRRLQAGQVVSYDLDERGKFINVKIFIQEPYDNFVTTNTRFWKASGLNLSLSANGLQVQTESLLSLLIGGIAFETPETNSDLPPAAENTTFTLFKDREAAFSPPPFNPQTFVVVFRESIRGLTIGAPVEYEGIPIGEVKDFQAQFDIKTYEFSVPVTIDVDPRRFGLKLIGGSAGPENEAERRKFLDAMVARGLRAQLQSGNLITGARYIDLSVVPDAPAVKLDWSQNPLELPVTPSPMASLEDNLAGIAKNLNSMPFKEIGDNLNKTLIGAQATLTNADGLLMNTKGLMAPGSALDMQLNAALIQIRTAAQSINLLADYLERHPEALIRGKTGDTK